MLPPLQQSPPPLSSPQSRHPYTHIQTRVDAYTCVSVHVRVRAHTSPFSPPFPNIHTYTYTYTCALMHVCTCKCIDTHTHTAAHSRTQMHVWIAAHRRISRHPGTSFAKASHRAIPLSFKPSGAWPCIPGSSCVHVQATPARTSPAHLSPGTPLPLMPMRGAHLPTLGLLWRIRPGRQRGYVLGPVPPPPVSSMRLQAWHLRRRGKREREREREGRRESQRRTRTPVHRGRPPDTASPLGSAWAIVSRRDDHAHITPM